ncbi:endonuclease/exonuclease/phosphatase family protein [Cellulomonas soli]|uniref:endonuclease/exonuclease/phosphatase family protein n=1 Tax=Cellulomonas soli TaxID=931535 RepID=UPI003F87F2DC
MSTGRPGPVACTVAAVLGVALGWLALGLTSGLFGPAQLVALRGVLACGAGVVALIATVVAWRAAPAHRPGAALVATVALLGALAQVGVLAVRSVPTGAAASGGATGTATDGGLVVLAFNTLDAVGAETLAALVVEQGADVAVLPETSAATATTTAELLAQQGYPMQVLTHDAAPAGIAGTALLVSPGVGTYSQVDPLPTALGSFVAPGAGSPSTPTLVAAHPAPPIVPSSMSRWRTDGELVAATCRATPGAVVAGDLNATVDHPQLRDLGPCLDVARAVGAGARGTWPASAPTLLAAPIDHVLVDGRVWRPVSFAVLPATGGSDHRPVVAHLVRRST